MGHCDFIKLSISFYHMVYDYVALVVLSLFIALCMVVESFVDADD